MITITLARGEADLEGILALQQDNLPANISNDELHNEGFVTVVHDLPILKKMHQAAQSIVAIENDQVIGYCLAMTRAFRDKIPVLAPMFDIIDGMEYHGKLLRDVPYIVSGQVCVSKTNRGQGLLGKMYQYYKHVYAKDYRVIITEIASRNPRSIRAHERVGFEQLHQYRSPDGETWEIVLWAW